MRLSWHQPGKEAHFILIPKPGKKGELIPRLFHTSSGYAAQIVWNSKIKEKKMLFHVKIHIEAVLFVQRHWLKSGLTTTWRFVQQRIGQC